MGSGNQQPASKKVSGRQASVRGRCRGTSGRFGIGGERVAAWAAGGWQERGGRRRGAGEGRVVALRVSATAVLTVEG